MFRLRRYRVFLLIAICSVASIYYLVQIRHATLSDVDQIRHLAFGTTSTEQSSKGKPETPPSKHSQDSPPRLESLPPPPDHEVVDNVKEATSTKVATQTALEKPKENSPTTTALDEVETTTGEELLQEGKVKKNPELMVNGKEEVQNPFLDDVPPPRWSAQAEHNPVKEDQLIKLPRGAAKALPQIQFDFPAETNTEKSDRLRKLAAIRGAFIHAWDGYKTYAMSHDELLPVSKRYSNSFMGWGATLVDTLDSLIIMGLDDEFENAVNETRKIDFRTSHKKEIPIFETVIRLLGGLISAYDLSKEKYPIILDKAVELADVLMGAFDTPNRMPDMYYKWAPSYASQQHRAGTSVVVAELGSLSMEFTRLAQLTNNHRYYDAIARIQNALEEWQMETEMPGLWPLRLDASGCKKIDRVKIQPQGSDDSEKPVLLGSAHVSEDELLNGQTPANLDSDKNSNQKEPSKQQVKNTRSVTTSISGQQERHARRDILNNQQKRSEPSATTNDFSDCIPQGLNYEPYAKTHTYSIAAQADSLYEYMPKMHRLLGGLSTQYQSMYNRAAITIREKVLYRPMLKDEQRKVLFPAEHNYNLENKLSSNQVHIVWEATHLGCFAGGMLGLAAKTFGLPSDMVLAEQLTDGCVWAYESTPTQIMPEKAALVPCEDIDTCPWDEKTWHKSLDPYLKERMDAVEAWNTEQKKLYKDTGINVAKGPIAAKAPPKSQPTVFKGGISKDGEVAGSRKGAKKRDPPVNGIPQSHQQPDNMEPPLEQFGFVPKVAMAHDRYVKARIQEERLPSSYTKIPDRSYILRPEAIESVFYMWRITGDVKWRQKGWKMFQAVQEATHTEAGNAGLRDVTSILGEKKDKMESFWLAETLKYFYLLFSEPSVVSLDEYVLNTEAHPFRVPRPVDD